MHYQLIGLQALAGNEFMCDVLVQCNAVFWVMRVKQFKLSYVASTV